MIHTIFWDGPELKVFSAWGKREENKTKNLPFGLSPKWSPRPLARLGLGWGHILSGDLDIAPGIQLPWAIACRVPPAHV